LGEKAVPWVLDFLFSSPPPGGKWYKIPYSYTGYLLVLKIWKNIAFIWKNIAFLSKKHGKI
jgi:hypothetical protein